MKKKLFFILNKEPIFLNLINVYEVLLLLNQKRTQAKSGITLHLGG